MYLGYLFRHTASKVTNTSPEDAESTEFWVEHEIYRHFFRRMHTYMLDRGLDQFKKSNTLVLGTLLDPRLKKCAFPATGPNSP